MMTLTPFERLALQALYWLLWNMGAKKERHPGAHTMKLIGKALDRETLDNDENH